MRIRVLLATAVVGVALVAPRVGSAQVPVAFAARPTFSASGLASVVFNGGTLDQLEAAAQSEGASGAWLQDSTGSYQLLVVGGPSFLKDALRQRFPGAIGVTAVTLSGGSSATQPPARRISTVDTPTPTPTSTATSTSRGTASGAVK